MASLQPPTATAAPTQQRKILHKSKLVIVEPETSTPQLPIFTHASSSRSERKDVELKLPMNPQSLVFYEHFATDYNYVNRLAFVCVGADEKNGQIFFNLRDEHQYKDVHTADFSEEFACVSTIFQVANQLETCREVRVFFNQKNNNLMLSALDKKLMQQYHQKCVDQRFVSTTVNHLKISCSGEFRKTNETRLHVLLNLAILNWPNLQEFSFDMEGGHGYIYDLLKHFCEKKGIIRRHSIQLDQNVVRCTPKESTDQVPELAVPRMSQNLSCLQQSALEPEDRCSSPFSKRSSDNCFNTERVKQSRIN